MNKVRRRITLVLLLAVGLLVAAYVMTSSSIISIEEAKARYASVTGEVTRDKAIRIFGKPSYEYTELTNTVIVWSFYRNSFDAMERLSIVWTSQGDENTGSLAEYLQAGTGADAWVARWSALKQILGLSKAQHQVTPTF